MLKILSTTWWTLTIRGALLILLGILAFVNPGGTAAGFVQYAGVLMMLEGAVALYAGISGKVDDENRWFVGLEGLLSIVIGLLIFRASVVVLVGVAFLLAAWMMIGGVIKIAQAIQLRKEIQGEFWMGLAGLIGIVGGLIIFGEPGIGIVTLSWIAGTFALLAGIFLVMMSLKLKKVQEHVRSRIGTLGN
jgi:uncharacterized membrane protein HdeD (DUF308 family)